MPKTSAELFCLSGAAWDRGEHRVASAALYSRRLANPARRHPWRAHKNLFLKDKKDNFFLVTVGEEAEVDLKQITT